MLAKGIKWLLSFALASVLCVGMVVPALASGQANTQIRSIVFTEGEAVIEAARQEVTQHGGVILKELATRNGLVVLIPEQARENIVKIPGVIAVEPDLVLSAVKGPPPGKGPKPKEPQPSENLPWGVDRIDAELVWDSNGDLVVDPGANVGAGVDVAIIDTGIDKDHQDLQANLAGGINFVGKGPSWNRKVDPTKWDDDNGHGTHVAGTVAAVDNDIGVIGIAPGASLWAVKVLDRTGSGYLSDVIDGIYWAADNGMEVINLSLGIDKATLDQYPNDRQALQDAVDYAYLTKGVVVVAAAGNEGAGEDTVIYPARFDSVIAVAATNNSDNRASFSSTGPAVELVAPGVDIYSTWNDGYYNTISGTSMASPHVAGTVALVIATGISDSSGNGLINDEVRARLQTTADDLGATGTDEYYGHGLVDAEEAATGIETSP
jgi:subtilisin family serine protease